VLDVGGTATRFQEIETEPQVRFMAGSPGYPVLSLSVNWLIVIMDVGQSSSFMVRSRAPSVPSNATFTQPFCMKVVPAGDAMRRIAVSSILTSTRSVDFVFYPAKAKNPLIK
jgi:hypothetical protein